MSMCRDWYLRSNRDIDISLQLYLGVLESENDLEKNVGLERVN